MINLIEVTVKDDKQLVSARDLHHGLKIKKHFTDWVKQNFKIFVENRDYTFSPKSVNVPNGGTKQIQDYAITIDMAKHIAMMSRTVMGKKFREYFIEVEKKWNDPKAVIARHAELLGHMSSEKLALRQQELDCQQDYLRIKERETANKSAELLIRVGDRQDDERYRNLYYSEAERLLMFPVAENMAMTASAVAEQLGTTAYNIGKWGQILGLKAPKGHRSQYGYWSGDRYYYNEKAIEKFQEHKKEIVDDDNDLGL